LAWHLYARGTASGVYLQNVPFFPTNLKAELRWGFNGIWNVSIITNTNIGSQQLQYTLDGGINWYPINQGQSIQSGDERIFNIKAEDKELFNMRVASGAGVTIARLLVSIAPQDIQRPQADISVNVPSPLPVDICPVNCPIDVNILNQPIQVTWPTPLPVDICPISCDVPVINGSVSPLQVAFAPPPVGTPNGVIILSKTGTAELANTDISGVDLSPSGTSPGDAVIFRIEWSADQVGVLSATLDSTNFVEFNNGANLRANSIHLFDMVVEHGDLFNLRFNKATNIVFLRVLQVL